MKVEIKKITEGNHLLITAENAEEEALLESMEPLTSRVTCVQTTTEPPTLGIFFTYFLCPSCSLPIHQCVETRCNGRYK